LLKVIELWIFENDRDVHIGHQRVRHQLTFVGDGVGG
jgi:hypothetical protein